MTAHQLLGGDAAAEAAAAEVLKGYRRRGAAVGFDLGDVRKLLADAGPVVTHILQQTQTPTLKQPAITPATPTSPSVPLAPSKAAGLSPLAIGGIAAAVLGALGLGWLALRGHRR